jgi:hypothetical protein
LGKPKERKQVIRGVINFVVLVGFTLLLPVFCIAA